MRGHARRASETAARAGSLDGERFFDESLGRGDQLRHALLGVREDREGIARTDVRGVYDDMPVLAFRDCIAALQRREGTEDIETPAERVEAFPLAGDLAGCDGR